MIICGIKLTHDGGIAVLKDDKLVVSIEMEKINNNPRYSEITDVDTIEQLLNAEGFSLNDIDHFVIDGWHGDGLFATGEAKINVKNGLQGSILPAAPYHEQDLSDSTLKRFQYVDKLSIGQKNINYSSYMHVAGHLMSAYCTGPAAQSGESSFILTWDGGQYPRLYYFDSKRQEMKNLGPIFLFLGTIYSIMAQYFGPYAKSEAQLEKERKDRSLDGFFGGYSVAGKIMSYIALGNVKSELLEVFDKVHKERLIVSDDFEHAFSRGVKETIGNRYNDADVLATFHIYLEQLLIRSLEKCIKKYPAFERNLCYAGGCALNIKWNNAIRYSGMFKSIWIPPFSNDSGSAIGMACCEHFNKTGKNSIDWNVYAGPRILKNSPAPGWSAKKMSVEKLSILLHETAEPVIFLNERAELGPRALGNRSILATATCKYMKDLLNTAKNRENFRPVAPICLEDYSDMIFDPGGSDPYMLFEHHVREEWIQKIPAIVHLDSTARVQTINKDQNHTVHQLLTSYYSLTGIPVLCNTSANLNGRGFFPDIFSATSWGKINYVWCDGMLYTKDDKINLRPQNELSA